MIEIYIIILLIQKIQKNNINPVDILSNKIAVLCIILIILFIINYKNKYKLLYSLLLYSLLLYNKYKLLCYVL